MDIQEKLNNVPLKEASKLISMALIEKKRVLLETRANLYALRKQYEADYVAANDGDSSENAPLEAAIENLKMSTGNIASNEAVIQSLEGIEDVDYLVGTYEFDEIETAYAKLPSIDKETVNSIYQCPDNADFIGFIKTLSKEELGEHLESHNKYNEENGKPVKSSLLCSKIAAYYKVCCKPPYNYCTIVVPYSTVRLKLIQDKGSRIITYKILPNGLSFIDIGAIALNSRLAQAIIGKQAGNTVSIQHASSGKIIRYEILEIY